MVADLIKAIALLGPLDMLRRSRSSVSTRCKLLRGLTGTGLLVAAPGREGALEKLATLESFGLGGETTTGPPSFLLMIAHRSGRREEKLQVIVRQGLGSLETHLQGGDDFDAEIPEHVVCMLDGGCCPVDLSGCFPRGISRAFPSLERNGLPNTQSIYMYINEHNEMIRFFGPD